MVPKLAELKQLGQRMWTSEFEVSSSKLQYPTFHGPTARKLIKMYAACIHRAEVCDTSMLHDKVG